MTLAHGVGTEEDAAFKAPPLPFQDLEILAQHSSTVFNKYNNKQYNQDTSVSETQHESHIMYKAKWPGIK